MRKLVFRCDFALGDVVLLTRAISDLHKCYPGMFVTDVRTNFPEVWQNNPNITHLSDADLDTEIIKCSYPLIDSSNFVPHHVIYGFIHFLNERLNLAIKPTRFHGDIFLTPEEKTWNSQVHEIVGADVPFWIVISGGKYDVTIKWWDHSRFQLVIDYFFGKVLFVQIGSTDHYHPGLKNVIDLRGKTGVRELLRLVYHAQGVLCPVAGLMHLAAAVEVKAGMPKNRPCVVVAGGREPPHWEAYPHHQFIHRNGTLLCCDNGGCWKSRVLPIGDGDDRDRPENLCVDVVKGLPRCMAMISADEVIARVQLYFTGGVVKFLNNDGARLAKKAIRRGNAIGWSSERLERWIHRREMEDFIRKLPNCDQHFKGQGIVICAGGPVYLTCAWVCVRMLRALGCSLPIQLWSLTAREITLPIVRELADFGVNWVDATEVQKQHPVRHLAGWELKPYSILHSGFEHVIYLDADNVPIVDPTFLLEIKEFQETGAIFWPDYGRLSPRRSIWKACGVSYREEPEFETGQIVVDKYRCWRALRLTMWINEHSDYFYRHVYGDKETFHMAFRKLNVSYAMPTTPIWQIPGTMCQHDFQGRRIFQHRNLAKWNINQNRRIRGFEYEDLCLEFISGLRSNSGFATDLLIDDRAADLEPSIFINEVTETSSKVLPGAVSEASDLSGRSARRRLRLLQVVPTRHDVCGVATFAHNLAQALRAVDIFAQTSQTFEGAEAADVVLIHAEDGILGNSGLDKLRRSTKIPVVLYAHSAGARKLLDYADALITTVPDVFDFGDKPILDTYLPAFVPTSLSDRSLLKRDFCGIEGSRIVIGTSGFVLAHRQLVEIISMLLPSALASGWFISLTLARHFSTRNSDIRRIEDFRKRYPATIGVHFGYVPSWELNRRLQACDLLWCWTANAPGLYASGVLSDMYASGTRVIASVKPQHRQVLALSNVVAAPVELQSFVETIVSEAKRGDFTRHDPSPVGWTRVVRDFDHLLRRLVDSKAKSAQ